jgi:hypothetical protein
MSRYLPRLLVAYCIVKMVLQPFRCVIRFQEEPPYLNSHRLRFSGPGERFPTAEEESLGGRRYFWALVLQWMVNFALQPTTQFIHF